MIHVVVRSDKLCETKLIENPFKYSCLSRTIAYPGVSRLYQAPYRLVSHLSSWSLGRLNSDCTFDLSSLVASPLRFELFAIHLQLYGLGLRAANSRANRDSVISTDRLEEEAIAKSWATYIWRMLG